MNFISVDCVIWRSGFLSENLAHYIDGKDMRWDICADRAPHKRSFIETRVYLS